MKKQLLLLALTLGTQVSAETIRDALGAQGEQYLTIINSAPINDFQAVTRKKLNKKLNQNLSALTPAELGSISESLADFATVVAPLLTQSKTSPSQEEFNTLIQQIRVQLEALANPSVQETVTTARSNPVSSVLQQGAPDPIESKTKKFVHFADSTLNQESDTDDSILNGEMRDVVDIGLEDNYLQPIEQPSITRWNASNEDISEQSQIDHEADETEIDRRLPVEILEDETLETLMLDVSELNKMYKNRESSSDINVNALVEHYKDTFKQLLEDNEWSRNDEVSDEENCKRLVQLFFNDLGLKTPDYDDVLPAFTDALVALQHEMSGRLALPVHPSLQTTNNNPLLDIPSINDQIEASITRLEKLDPTEADNIKKLFAKNKAKLQAYLSSLDEESCTSPVSHSDSDSGTVFGSNDSGDDTVYNNEVDLKKTLSPLITKEERARFLQDRSEDREFNDAELLTQYRDYIISLDGPLTEELSAQVNKRIENLEDLLEQEKEFNEIDSLLAQLEEEGAQGLDPVQLPSKKTNRSRSSEENRQRNRAMRKIHQGSESFIKEFQETLERLIFNKMMQDGQFLDKNGCRTLLLSFFNTLDLNEEYANKYDQMLPQLIDKLLVVQEGLKERRQRVLDSSPQDLNPAQLSSEETPAQREKKQRSKARKAIWNGNFNEQSQQNLQSLIRQAWAQNGGQTLNRNGLVQILVPFLNSLGFKPEDYQPKLPMLLENLTLIQDEMLASSQPQVDVATQPAEDTDMALVEALRNEYADQSALFNLYDDSDYQSYRENASL